MNLPSAIGFQSPKRKLAASLRKASQVEIHRNKLQISFSDPIVACGKIFEGENRKHLRLFGYCQQAEKLTNFVQTLKEKMVVD